MNIILHKSDDVISYLESFILLFFHSNVLQVQAN